jgi:alkyl sulfatase BDS1-like metallo-beta-lactamase superfamily hydrolase
VFNSLMLDPGTFAALVEREAITLPLHHAIDFELADVGSAAVEMQRQCRRADGRGLSGSRSRDRLGDGRDGPKITSHGSI